MREIKYQDIVNSVKNIILHTSTVLPQDMLNALKKAYEEEESEVAKEVIRQLLDNAKIAKEEKRPLCQDTGLAVFFCKTWSRC